MFADSYLNIYLSKPLLSLWTPSSKQIYNKNVNWGFLNKDSFNDSETPKQLKKKQLIKY